MKFIGQKIGTANWNPGPTNTVARDPPRVSAAPHTRYTLLWHALSLDHTVLPGTQTFLCRRNQLYIPDW